MGSNVAKQFVESCSTDSKEQFKLIVIISQNGNLVRLNGSIRLSLFFQNNLTQALDHFLDHFVVGDPSMFLLRCT